MRAKRLKLRSLLLFTLFLLLFTIPIEATIQQVTLDDNNPPDPPLIEGEIYCKIRQEYLYNFTITDPDGHRLTELIVIFGDGTNITLEYQGSSCHKGWRSGMILDIKHIWKQSDDYMVKAKVKDMLGEWSDWGYLEVTAKASDYKIIQQLIGLLFGR